MAFIHIFEIITLLLVVGKLFHIRRLYRQSNKSALKTKKRHINKPSSGLSRNGLPRNSLSKNKEILKIESEKLNGIYNRFTTNYSQQNLPLPEVSFTEGLPLPEVSFSSNDESLHFTNNKPQSKHKAILNNYIEDFFFETPEVFHEAEVVEFKKYKMDSNAEDEFITVADDHAEVVRAFESLNSNVCLVR